MPRTMITRRFGLADFAAADFASGFFVLARFRELGEVVINWTLPVRLMFATDRLSGAECHADFMAIRLAAYVQGSGPRFVLRLPPHKSVLDRFKNLLNQVDILPRIVRICDGTEF